MDILDRRRVENEVVDGPTYLVREDITHVS